MADLTALRRVGSTAQQREADLYVLGELATWDVTERDYGDEEHVTDAEAEAFGDMRESLTRAGGYPVLTATQRGWALRVASRLGIDPRPPGQRPQVPRGAEVPLALGLQNLPKRPPGARR